MPAVDSPSSSASASRSVAFTVVVLAKPPVAGEVKTRLTRARGGMLCESQAAAVHAAMLQCVLHRLAHFLPGPRVLALAGGAPAAQRHGLAPQGWAVIDQGAGDLGRRLDHTWRAIGGGAAAFFGADSPDVPPHALAAIAPALTRADAACGPAPDGGYWTLAAAGHLPPLLRGIDWGGEAVYDQTRRAADHAGVTLAALPTWCDVDGPDDLADLQSRLRTASEPALVTLRRRLRGAISGPTTAGASTPTPPFLCHGSASPMNPSSAHPTPRAADDDGAPSHRLAPGASDPQPAPTEQAGGGAMASRPQEHSGSVGEAPLEDSTLLIVDDNDQNRELLQAYLEALPCNIVTAGDGVEALALIEDASQPTPDLILLDVMMPRMSGFEVCRKLKDDPHTRSIPIMMVTALNELGDIERGVESGTDDFVTKPVNKLELITRVKSLLRVRQLKRELDRSEAHIRDLQGRENAGD